jgi:hypothetical protein
MLMDVRTMSLWIAPTRAQIDRYRVYNLLFLWSLILNQNFVKIFELLSDLLMGALDAQLANRSVWPSQRTGLRVDT